MNWGVAEVYSGGLGDCRWREWRLRYERKSKRKDKRKSRADWCSSEWEGRTWLSLL